MLFLLRRPDNCRMISEVLCALHAIMRDSISCMSLVESGLVDAGANEVEEFGEGVRRRTRGRAGVNVMGRSKSCNAHSQSSTL